MMFDRVGIAILMMVLGCNSPEPTPAPEVDTVAIEELQAEVEVKSRTIEELRGLIADLEGQVADLKKAGQPQQVQQKAEPEQYIPSFSWPDSTKPNRIERLRQHLRSENIHRRTDVDTLSPTDLAFTHDVEHVEEYLRLGRVPVMKDKRLVDWYRSRTMKTVSVVDYIVIESGDGCPPCAQWKQTEAPQFEAAGIRVQVETAVGGRIPRWRVHLKDGTIVRVPSGDWLNKARLERLLRDRR